jgi:2-polyprenyl-3-methyl-5-hydroxy-6-metoxy-1,4-benzoquinol methylase
VNSINVNLDHQSSCPASGAPSELTPRQEREQAFYDRFSQTRKDAPASFDPIASDERRPWNSYWEALRIAEQHYQPGGRLLDLGCGWGEFTVIYAKIGYRVDGCDISEMNLQAARNLAERYNLSPQVTLTQQAAERLQYPDESFDVIAGIDILHHVDVPAVIAQCRRVLKPGGIAFFREPVLNPVFDWLRNRWIVRRILPNDASIERHITHDERKLSSRELDAIRRTFPTMTVRRFQVLSRLAVLFKSSVVFLERVDYSMRWIPGYQKLAGSVIIELRK